MTYWNKWQKGWTHSERKFSALQNEIGRRELEMSFLHLKLQVPCALNNSKSDLATKLWCKLNEINFISRNKKWCLWTKMESSIEAASFQIDAHLVYSHSFDNWGHMPFWIPKPPWMKMLSIGPSVPFRGFPSNASEAKDKNGNYKVVCIPQYCTWLHLLRMKTASNIYRRGHATIWAHTSLNYS